METLFSRSWMAFFKSSEFLYFHSILISLEISNVILFILTWHNLMSHWKTAAETLDIQSKMHFGIVVKLFFITGTKKTVHKGRVQKKKDPKE